MAAPQGPPPRFPPVCGCVGWAGKAVARHMAHPRQRPGVLRAWGSRPALCAIACLFRAGPPKTRSPMDPPGKGTLPHRRTTRARAPNTPQIRPLRQLLLKKPKTPFITIIALSLGFIKGAYTDPGADRPPHNHHHSAPLPPTSVKSPLRLVLGGQGLSCFDGLLTV